MMFLVRVKQAVMVEAKDAETARRMAADYWWMKPDEFVVTEIEEMG